MDKNDGNYRNALEPIGISGVCAIAANIFHEYTESSGIMIIFSLLISTSIFLVLSKIKLNDQRALYFFIFLSSYASFHFFSIEKSALSNIGGIAMFCLAMAMSILACFRDFLPDGPHDSSVD